MKLYCGTYGKYNAGSLKGEWMDLADYADADEFLEACRELHEDEPDAELMFQDVETDEDWEKGCYSESAGREDIQAWYDITDALERHGVSSEVFNAWVKVEGEGECTEEGVERCAECYCGYYSGFNPGADYAEQLAEDCGDMSKDNWLMNYIDWDRVWRDMTYDGYAEYDGHIFNTNAA